MAYDVMGMRADAKPVFPRAVSRAPESMKSIAAVLIE